MRRIFFSTLLILLAVCLFQMLSVMSASAASAGLVYEQKVLLKKIEQAKIEDKKDKDGKKEDAKKKDENKFEFTQRILLKGNKMKIRNSGGWTFYLDLDTKKITRLDRNRGVITTLTFDQYLGYRAETEKKVQVKKAAHARFLQADIWNSIKAIKNPSEREKALKNPPKIIKDLQLIIDGKYSYSLYKDPKVGKQSSKAFKALKYAEVLQNKNKYLELLGTSEIPFCISGFLSKLAFVPLPAANLLGQREDFLAELEFPYDFETQTVNAYVQTLGYCPADLPDVLFDIPTGYKEQNERFETIFETPKF